MKEPGKKAIRLLPLLLIPLFLVTAAHRTKSAAELPPPCSQTLTAEPLRTQRQRRELLFPLYAVARYRSRLNVSTLRRLRSM